MPKLESVAAQFEAALTALETQKGPRKKINSARVFLQGHAQDELDGALVSKLQDFLSSDNKPSFKAKARSIGLTLTGGMFFSKPSTTGEHITQLFKEMIKIVTTAVRDAGPYEQIGSLDGATMLETKIDLEKLAKITPTISSAVDGAQNAIAEVFNTLEGKKVLSDIVHALLEQAKQNDVKGLSLSSKLKANLDNRARTANFYTISTLGEIFKASGEVSRDGALSRDDFATAIVDQYRSQLSLEARKHFQALEAISASIALVMPNIETITELSATTYTSVAVAEKYKSLDTGDKILLISSALQQISMYLDTAKGLVKDLPIDQANVVRQAIIKIRSAVDELATPGPNYSAKMTLT